MKKVMFEVNIELEVENWVNFVAQDEDGYIFGYKLKPNIINIQWNNRGGRCIYLHCAGKSKNWKNSLIEVKS